MTSPIQIREQDKRILDAILTAIVPGIRLWVYGSRVKGTARPTSDLDLVLFLPAGRLAQLAVLREALEESSLPFRVDLHIWDALPADIQRHIEAQHVQYRPTVDAAAS